ncbi:hypothetical protein NESM_000202200 [Novymonas esmeraldas]|uniref:Uncharacterized protein n=1 Tax=Novymonas esmeraldas TaxID=1808958 RepID=A0AAW0F6M0_9TRYP
MAGVGGGAASNDEHLACRHASSASAPPRAAWRCAPAPPLVRDASFAFALTAADECSVPFLVTPYMCAHSPYLRSARDVAATEGTVPVGTAQAVRDYVAYLHYCDLREQLAAELARCTAVSDTAASSSPASAEPPAWRTAMGDAVRDGRHGELHDAEVPLPSPWGEDVPVQYGAHGVTAQPLDCDRAYTRHATRLRRWFTAAELASFRGGSGGGGDAVHVDAGDVVHRGTRSPVVTAAAATLAPPPRLPADPHSESHSPLVADAPRPFPAAAEALSTSSSLTSSASTASLEAYESAARASDSAGGPQRGRRHPGTCLGEDLGYGEYTALDDPDGLFFIEQVLLTAHKPPHGTPSQEPACAGRPALSVRQQCRLLELIAVADFMGTQRLVEVCATHLAAWLMDTADDELVRGFIAPPGTADAPVSFTLTSSTTVAEPWIVPVTEVRGAAPAPSLQDADAPIALAGDFKTRREAAAAAAKRGGAGAAAAPTKRAAKQKGKSSAHADVVAAHGAGEHDGNDGVSSTCAPPRATLDVSAPPLLSGDQKLSLLRQMKRDNSIIVSPY